MSWTVEFEEELGIIVVTYVGKCNGRDFRDASDARIAMAEEKGSPKTLIDAARLETDELTSSDVYQIVTRIYERLGNRIDWKIAITMPGSPASRDQVSFYVTMCVNCGWQARWFEERSEALEWLLAS